MKKLLISTALSLALTATTVHAQSAQPAPQMSSSSIASGTSSSAAGILVPILAVVFIAAILWISTGSSYGYYTMSDERLKDNIRPVGALPNGLTLYEFTYQGRSEVYRGVMAQEVQALMPRAVHQHESGYLYVNYDMLGIAMERVN